VKQEIRFEGPGIPNGFYWFNPPSRYRCDDGLEIITDVETDFWQRTHYGFQRDNGHCLFTRLAGNFRVSTQARFMPETQYDQCGLMVRADAGHWIKLSTELENQHISRLGSVVTNQGYSDWATQDVRSDITERWYRISRCENDFLLESAEDGQDWKQLRITHLHNAPETLEVGLYACSPIGANFCCRFPCLKIDECTWGECSHA